MLSEGEVSLLRRDAHDIIVIGGGTIGYVLANRPSEDLALMVLMLEASNDENEGPRVFAPEILGPLMGFPEFDWQCVPPEARMSLVLPLAGSRWQELMKRQTSKVGVFTIHEVKW